MIEAKTTHEIRLEIEVDRGIKIKTHNSEKFFASSGSPGYGMVLPVWTLQIVGTSDESGLAVTQELARIAHAILDAIEGQS